MKHTNRGCASKRGKRRLLDQSIIQSRLACLNPSCVQSCSEQTLIFISFSDLNTQMWSVTYTAIRSKQSAVDL